MGLFLFLCHLAEVGRSQGLRTDSSQKATRCHMEPRAPCPAAIPSMERKFHVLVGVTGSVAALKLPLLVSKLLDIPGLEVTVVTTERAKHFYSPQDVPVTLYSDADEWEMWKRRSDPVLHIDLRRWADLMLVAPLDANTLGKVASGICDNLLSHLSPKSKTQFSRLSEKAWKETGKKDLCHPGLGPHQASTLLPRHEHRHVGAPSHRTAGGHAQGLRLCGDSLCEQEAGVWRPRSRSHGRGGDHCGESERSTLPARGHPAELNWGFCPGVRAPSEFSLSC
ncbi:phosphopantothenoylcysteine decarboxylase isoform X2 [Microtus oregoni]|uniref:phosphopantothenoylcysteine decarboxylase isoform X2 n=1 Tax=Microtus oregoni TaxID=111838 RepID=UPI001BB2B3CA|nr:phosphopantothenoylcysteine decarboxylase isoform X2 [Microtus oregoni]